MTAKEQEDLEFQKKLEDIARQHGATYRGESREPGDLTQETEDRARTIHEIAQRVDELTARVQKLERKEGK